MKFISTGRQDTPPNSILALLIFWLAAARVENPGAAAHSYLRRDALVAASGAHLRQLAVSAGSGFQAQTAPGTTPATETSPERRALDYLSREVPRWSAENHCYSCHNNGDGARALYTARGLGDSIAASAIDDTTAWLSRPGRWNEPGSEVEFGDSKMARLQFASALAAALEAGVLQDPQILSQAADGSWRVGAEGLLGSPVTYGTCLATHMARRILARSGQARFAGAIERADQWLARANVSAVIDAASVALALRDHTDPAATASATRALDLIIRAQGSEGGWGPYRNSPPEAFDTAMALLALATRRGRGDAAEAIRRGRAYLVSIQLPSGAWTGTTRPPGAQSYAQHISTSAWATMALLLTR